MAECCKLAFFQTAKTLGREIRFKGINCYITGSEQATGALLMITDVYGWTLNNARAAADRIATDAGIAVYLPEFFEEGDHAPFPADERARWDIGAFMKRNPPTNFEKIDLLAKGILESHKKLGAMGYCWGAQGALHLGAKDTGIASAVGFAHPDNFFPSERRQAAEQVMFKKADEEGLSSKFVVYPGTVHGNLTRGDEKNALTARAMADSLQETALFLKAFVA